MGFVYKARDVSLKRHVAVKMMRYGSDASPEERARFRSEAEPLFRRALKMRERLYPNEKYPRGHPDLAVSLTGLGFVLQAQGENGKAEPLMRRALEVYETLYPKDQYPNGHP